MIVANGLQVHRDILIDQIRSLSRQIASFRKSYTSLGIETPESTVVVSPITEDIAR